uniref:Uncharacterized protein n=1 Tax=Anguilla anguilla TaxID=7936 RepID=A0A0E9S5C9_ANGAN
MQPSKFRFAQVKWGDESATSATAPGAPSTFQIPNPSR